MDKKTEQRIRDLAQPLWESASQPYNMALDFWIMAEQMVVDLSRAATHLHLDISKQVPPFVPSWLPNTAPVDRVRALANTMWEAAGHNYETAQDCWLAAEQHVYAMIRAAAVPENSNAHNHWARQMATLTPDDYLERIRTAAYFLWEAAGHQYGRSLDYWIEAERSVLQTLTAMARGYEEGRAEGASLYADLGPIGSKHTESDQPSSYH